MQRINPFTRTPGVAGAAFIDQILKLLCLILRDMIPCGSVSGISI